jgi:hypothetical protein
MKYLKIYELFNKTEFYDDVTESEFINHAYKDNLVRKDCLSGPERLEIVKRKLPNYKYTFSNGKTYDFSLDISSRGEVYTKCLVQKCDDGWFYTAILNNQINSLDGADYYKCDRLEGLLMFLEDYDLIS